MQVLLCKLEIKFDQDPINLNYPEEELIQI